jgi:hypothetical protein
MTDKKFNISFTDVGSFCGIVGLLVALGLGLWLIGLVLAFLAGVLARPRLESMIGGLR